MAADLFGPRPRAPRRKLMTLRDAGWNVVHFVCGHCSFDEGWTRQTETNSAVKRGRPCPNCNPSKETARG